MLLEHQHYSITKQWQIQMWVCTVLPVSYFKKFNIKHTIETEHFKKCNSNFNIYFYRQAYEFKVNIFLLSAPLRFPHHSLFHLIARRKNILLKDKRCRREITICR